VPRRPLCFIGSALLFFSTEASATNTPRESRVSNNVQEAINNTIQSLIAAVSARDIQQVMSVYAETVDYHEKGRVPRDVVRGDFEDYFSRWPIIRWALAGPINVRETGRDRAQVSFEISFDVADEAEKRRSSGRAGETCLVEFNPVTKMSRIVAQHEKILERQVANSTVGPFPPATASKGQASPVQGATSMPVHIRPPASAAEAQRNLDAAASSGHVGHLLQNRAEQEQLGQEIRNEWPLPPELMPEWKHALIGDVDSASWFHAERMNDQQLGELRRKFDIPKDEEIYAYHDSPDSQGVVTDDSGFEAVVTDKALYLHLLTRDAFEPWTNRRLPDSVRHAADPIGLFRIAHSGILATDTFSYNATVVPYSDKHTANGTWNCINVFGCWMTGGKLVVDFGKTEGPADCGLGENGQLVPASDYSYRHLQTFLASILKCNSDFAIKAARQRHLQNDNQGQSRPSAASANPPADSFSSPDALAGYLGAPWGSSFAEMNRKLAAKAARDYREVRISEAEWNRGYAGAAQEVRRFIGWGVPLGPPLSFFTFTDETGVKTFLFHRDRLYAVTNLSDKDWVQRNGVDTLLVMCRKYGQPSLHFARSWTATNDVPLAPREVDYGGDLIRAVWESDSGAIFSPLKAMKNGNHLNIHPLRQSYVSISVPPENIKWMIHVEATGFVPPNTGKESQITLKAPPLGNGPPRDVSVQFPSVPTSEIKGKLLALILNIEWSRPEDSATSNSAALANLSSKVRVTDQRNNSYKPIFSALSPRDIVPLDHQYPPAHGDAEWFAFFDIPMNVEDASLQIESPEITDLAGNKVQTEGTQIIDLEQTKYQWICAGPLTEKEMEQYQFSIAGATTYVSMPIFGEMTRASETHRAEQEQKKKDVEKKRQKELEEKF
jgi:hypothetical protein